ncbi:MAG: hypothetical protein PHW04_04305 [Candidatus Wallbacteria bacterium]|nr:hypothetical protein [Candidatus Wallbacteria bacterium]
MDGDGKNKKLGQILLESGAINSEVLAKVLKLQPGSDELIGQLLVQEGAINLDDLAKGLATQFHMPFFDITSYPPPESLLSETPPELMVTYNFLPLKKLPDKIIVIIDDPTDQSMLADLKLHYADKVEFFLGNREKISAKRKKYLSRIGKIEETGTEADENLSFLKRFLKTGSLEAALSDGRGEIRLPEAPRADVARMGKEAGIQEFLEMLKDPDRHFIVAMQNGEKFAGSVLDSSEKFILISTSTGKKLLNFTQISYIEEKEIKRGGEV